ncbi:MAG TPA: ComEA family DNA-binding protein [Abditibacteriaceae bacterium]
MSHESLPQKADKENESPMGGAGEKDARASSSWKTKAAVAAALVLVLLGWWKASVQRSATAPVEFSADEASVPASMPLRGTPKAQGPLAARNANEATIKVHIAGRVKKPGVYALPPNSRIADAIQRAGGAQKDGDVDAINLAAWAEDGSRIEVPPKETAAPAVETPRITRDSLAAADLRAAPRPKRSRVAVLPEAPSKSTVLPAVKFPIDINRADAQTLEALPGVGPSTAQKILAYREENGSFQSVDDLDEVKGIGPVKLEKMRPFVLVR